MVDNQSKISLISQMQKKYITHRDDQYNTHATHSYNYIVIFILDIFLLYIVVREVFAIVLYFATTSVWVVGNEYFTL